MLAVALAVQGAGSLPASPPIAAQAAITAPPAGDPMAGRLDLAPLVAVHLAPPVRLLIPALHINAAVEALGVDRSGALQTPHNIWNVGWYRGGPSPGGPGDAVIDGHVGLPGSPLVFSGLARLAVGADVIVVHADGTRSRFRVSGMRSWPANSRPNALFSSAGRARLSLITCIGSYDRRSQTYADRLIVEASYVGPA
jgi:hypothetical protein